MHRSLWGDSMRIFMHEQWKLQSKLTWKHVMFRWQLDIHFHWSKTTSLETRTLKLTIHWNMLSFDRRPNTHFDARATQAPETYPAETCNILGAMFQPHPLIFHFPPCDPHPCPINHCKIIIIASFLSSSNSSIIQSRSSIFLSTKAKLVLIE
jgi:hypothetical protein